MSELSDIRDQIMGSTMASQREAARASHESTVTRRILTRLRPDISIPSLLKAHDNCNLSLGLLQVALPDFPIRLVAEHTPQLWAATVSEFVSKPQGSRIWKAYANHLNVNGWDTNSGCYGLIVVWPDVGSMVIHNWPRTEERIDRHRGYTRITFVHSRGATPQVYSIEPVDTLIDAIQDAGLCHP